MRFFSGHIGLEILEEISGALIVLKKRKATELTLLSNGSARGFPSGSVVKNLPEVQETWVQSLGWKDPLEEGMATHSSPFLENPHGQRSLVGCSSWDCKESDTIQPSD